MCINNYQTYLGKRQCPGEHLARMVLFLFSAAILQNFEISESENCSVTLEPNPSVSVMNFTQEQEMTFNYRNH